MNTGLLTWSLGIPKLDIPKIDFNTVTKLESVTMGKKMFILEMERGTTECKNCPFSFYDGGDYTCCNEDLIDKLKCWKNDLSTINVRELFDKDNDG